MFVLRLAMTKELLTTEDGNLLVFERFVDANIYVIDTLKSRFDVYKIESLPARVHEVENVRRSVV